MRGSKGKAEKNSPLPKCH